VLAMFFGLTDSACEILRDRALIKRESNYKLFVPGYLLAKTLVLTGIAGTQCALYLLVGNFILEIHDMFWSHLGIMVLTAFVGIAMSLMVSAFVRSDRTALNIVPLLLVPQILLAGALVRFEEMNEYCPSVPDYLIPDSVENALSNLRHRVAYQDETTHNILTKPVPLIAEFCPLRYAFEMMFVLQTSFNPWEIENARIAAHRDYVKEHGDSDDIRFVQRAALLLNTTAPDPSEARILLHRVRKAATMNDEEYLLNLEEDLDSRPEELTDSPLEFFFSNRKLTALREGVKTARKDGRLVEHRGFFLSPRQAPPFGGLDQETDAGSIPTLGRNAIFLAIMGLIPILLAGWKLRKICRG
ncbi:MAG: ABC transporter permease, partial [Akkermansia sp.]|nr:ABC transporter permease [Akkermansia sp.]